MSLYLDPEKQNKTEISRKNRSTLNIEEEQPNKHYKITIKVRKKPISKLVLAGLLVLVFFIIFGASSLVQAGKVDLYAGQCLGDWQNPEFAEGLESATRRSDISAENSTVLMGEVKQIFCGDFKSDIPAGADIRKVSLNLSWKMEDAAPVPEVPAEGGNTQTDGVPAGNEPIQNVPAESILFIPRAHAQEIPEEVASIPPAEDSALFVDDGLANEADTPVESGDLFLIRYSTDGATWQTAAMVNKKHFYDSISLPLNSVEEISRLKISIEPLSAPKDFKVLLDAVVLTIHYENTEIVDLSEFTDLGNTAVSDSKKFTFANLVSGKYIVLSVKKDADQGEILAIEQSGKGGSVSFYKPEDELFSIVSGIGDSALETPSYQFSAGHFVAVLSKEPSECTTGSIAECRNSGGYISEASFDVETTKDTPLEYRPAIKLPEIKDILLRPEPGPATEEKVPVTPEISVSAPSSTEE